MANFSRITKGPALVGEYIPEVARSYQVHFCGECANAHILLLDAEGEGIAQMNLSLDQARELVLSILQNVTGSEL